MHGVVFWFTWSCGRPGRVAEAAEPQNKDPASLPRRAWGSGRMPRATSQEPASAVLVAQPADLVATHRRCMTADSYTTCWLRWYHGMDEASAKGFFEGSKHTVTALLDR